MHSVDELAELCSELSTAMALDGSSAQRMDGQLHGQYAPKTSVPSHPRPMGVIGALHSANEALADQLDAEGCLPPDVSAWLDTMSRDSPLWELQLVAIAVLFTSAPARANLALACPAPVVSRWLDTLPDRVRGKMFGTHGGTPLTVIQAALPASQLVVTEVMALRRAYESCECV
jgi:hypothetical protein